MRKYVEMLTVESVSGQRSGAEIRCIAGQKQLVHVVCCGSFRITYLIGYFKKTVQLRWQNDWLFTTSIAGTNPCIKGLDANHEQNPYRLKSKAVLGTMEMYMQFV